LQHSTQSQADFSDKSTGLVRGERRRTWTKLDGEQFFESTNAAVFKSVNIIDIYIFIILNLFLLFLGFPQRAK